MSQPMDSGFRANQIITTWKCTEKMQDVDRFGNPCEKECGYEDEVPLTDLAVAGIPQCIHCECDLELQDKVLVKT